MKKYIYLAGPIAGCTKEEATEWREYVCTFFPHVIIGISPLRCEPIEDGKRYTQSSQLRFRSFPNRLSTTCD